MPSKKVGIEEGEEGKMMAKKVGRGDERLCLTRKGNNGRRRVKASQSVSQST